MNAEPRKDLLLLLADKLEAIPAERFNMASWVSLAYNDCGTTACALGWAATMPEFNAEGLRLGVRRSETARGRVLIVDNLTAVPEPVRNGERQSHVEYWRGPVLYRDDTAVAYGFEAATILFDLPPGHAVLLFSKNLKADNSPHGVAQRLRAYAADPEAWVTANDPYHLTTP